MGLILDLLILLLFSFVSSTQVLTFEDCLLKPPGLTSSAEDSYLSVELDEDETLFAPPGTRREISLRIVVSEDSFDGPANVYISYREEFGGTGDNHRQHHHAELVRRIDPRVVKIVTPNVTIDVTLSVDIPSYVSQASQSKITVTARMQPVNTSQLTVG